MSRKHAKAAKARGLIDARLFSSVYPKGSRRTCVTCGRGFNSIPGGTHLFGCGCCAYAYGDPKTKDRSIRKGDRVVLLYTGEAAVVSGIAQDDDGMYAVVTTDKGQQYRATLKDVERLFDVATVEHAPNCTHGRPFKWKPKPKKEEERNEDLDG